MGFLRRLLGGDGAEPEREPSPPVDPMEADAAEAAYELELLRDDQARMSELVRRQQRYSEYSWKPPPEGGKRRADDEDEGEPEADRREDELADDPLAANEERHAGA